jgi:hypothetical protein
MSPSVHVTVSSGIRNYYYLAIFHFSSTIADRTSVLTEFFISASLEIFKLPPCLPRRSVIAGMTRFGEATRPSVENCVAGRVPHHHEVITKVYTFQLLSFLLECPKSAAHAASGKWGPGLGTRALLGSRLEGKQESSI